MRIIRRTFANLPGSTLLLGRAGENNVTKLELDVSKEQSEFASATFELVLKTPAADDPYPVVVDVTDGKLTYYFSGSDLAESGTGQLEAMVCGSGGELLKTATAKIKINPSIIPNTYPGPLQKVIDDLKEAIGEIDSHGIKTVTELPEDPEDDEIVYLNAKDSGFYRWDGSDWVRLTDDGEGLESLANVVSDMGDQLDKIAVAEKYSDLSEETDAFAAFVYGLDGGQKSLADYDPETDADAELLIAESVDYEESVVIRSDTIPIHGSESNPSLGELPVYNEEAIEQTDGGFGFRLITTTNEPMAYMPAVQPKENLTERDIQKIVDTFGVVIPYGANVMFLSAYAFENISGNIFAGEMQIGDTVNFEIGWNAFVAVISESIAVYVFNDYEVNEFFDIGTLVSIEEYPSDISFLLDTIVLNGTIDKRGVYVKTNDEWIDPYKGELDSLESRVKILEDGEPDDVSLLGFDTYSDLVVRDEAVTGESIQDVPVYVQGGRGIVCSLYKYTSDPVWLDYDYGIELSDLRQYDTGMPLFVVSVTVGGVRYNFFPQDYNAGTGIVQAGWNVNDQPSDPPTISGFSPDRFSFGGVVYDDLDDLPDAAKSALRSLSQCINVSASAMGTIRVPDDAVLRFAGKFDANRKYAFKTSDDCTFTLPSVPFGETDAQFVLYLTCTADVDITFPTGTYFSNEINSDTGNHKLIGCWLKEKGKWAIGCIDYEVPA